MNQIQSIWENNKKSNTNILKNKEREVKCKLTEILDEMAGGEQKLGMSNKWFSFSFKSKYF